MIYLRNLLLTVSLSGFASFTFAQSDADQEEVVVTGSRIEDLKYLLMCQLRFR